MKPICGLVKKMGSIRNGITETERRTLISLERWYQKTGCLLFILLSAIILFIFGLLLELPWIKDLLFSTSYYQVWGTPVSWFITAPFVFVLLGLVVFSGWDFLAWCFRAIEELAYPEEWYTAEIMESLRIKLCDGVIDDGLAEIILIKELPFEIKYFVLRLSLRLVSYAVIFFSAFAEIFTLVNRTSIGTHAFTDIDPDASIFWHFFYSIDVVTSLGGAAPTPNVDNSVIWVFSGIQLIFTIIYVLVFLTLSISSVYEIFNLKTSYIPAFVKHAVSTADDKKNAGESDRKAP